MTNRVHRDPTLLLFCSFLAWTRRYRETRWRRSAAIYPTRPFFASSCWFIWPGFVSVPACRKQEWDIHACSALDGKPGSSRRCFASLKYWTIGNWIVIEKYFRVALNNTDSNVTKIFLQVKLLKI